MEGGPRREGIGRSRGGFTSKLHIRGNAHGLPIAFHLTAGQEADCSNYDALVEAHDSDPATILADKATTATRSGRTYATAAPCRRSRACGTAKSNHSVSRSLYALRSRIECFINRLKNSHRVATRHNQSADSFLGFATLSSIRLWIRFVHAT